MRRTAAAVLILACAAVLLSLLAFGWAALLMGAPVLVATVLTVGVACVTEEPRRRLQVRRAARRPRGPGITDGSSNAFFELPG